MRVKNVLSFNQLLNVMEFLNSIVMQLVPESKYHRNLCDNSPIEHMSRKVSSHNMSRTRHFQSEVQFNYCNFSNKLYFLYLLKTRHRTCFLEKANTEQLHDDYSQFNEVCFLMSSFAHLNYCMRFIFLLIDRFSTLFHVAWNLRTHDLFQHQCNIASCSFTVWRNNSQLS